MPLVSVIIPVYGTERFIARCLDSLFAQSFKDFEIIIVNDCTKDKSMTIVREYAKRHNNIKVVEHASNQGPMVARESGYRGATGKYLVFPDSDDTLPENALDRLYYEITKSDVKIVRGGYRYIFDNGSSEDRKPSCLGTYNTKEGIELCLKGKMNHNLAFTIFDRKLFEKEFQTFPNQNHAEDMMLFYQLLREAGSIKVIPDIVYDYYQNFASSSNTAPNRNILRQLAKAQNFKYEFCSGLHVDKAVLYRNILRIVATWLTVEGGKEVYKELHKDIRTQINPVSFFRYLPATKAIYYTLLKYLPSLTVRLLNHKR